MRAISTRRGAAVGVRRGPVGIRRGCGGCNRRNICAPPTGRAERLVPGEGVRRGSGARVRSEGPVRFWRGSGGDLTSLAIVFSRLFGVWRGFGGGLEGICRSSLDARKPQNPTNSEEYQGHLQGTLYSTRGAQKSKTLVANVVNIQKGLEGVAA
eukprot:607066-Prorocentrum_minimum.AAC.1